MAAGLQIDVSAEEGFLSREWADRLEAAEQAGGSSSGRFSPIYDKYGYSSWGTYSRRHDYSRSTHHREEHGRYGLEPFDQSFPNFEEEWW